MLPYCNIIMMWGEMKFNEFFRDESGEVNVVSIVVLIGIAVILALVFKEGITTLLKSLLSTIQTNATDAVNSK